MLIRIATCLCACLAALSAERGLAEEAKAAPAPAAVTPAEAGVAATRTARFEVTGMVCPVNCPTVFEEKIKTVAGVSVCAVDFDKRQAAITFDSSKTSTAALIAALKGTQYTMAEAKAEAAQPAEGKTAADRANEKYEPKK